MQIFIGQTASISKTFSSEDVYAFSDLSMDTNPLHLDENYAKSTIFGRRIVHGFLSGSLISAVIGTILPGEGAIYLHQDMDFKKPVYLDEKITATVTVVRKNEEKHIFYLDTKCANDDGEVKIEGTAIIKYKEK